MNTLNIRNDIAAIDAHEYAKQRKMYGAYGVCIDCGKVKRARSKHACRGIGNNKKNIIVA